MNNFKQIKTLLSFKDSGDFYFIQIFKRRKDNPELPKSEKLIKSYSVFSLEEYDKLEEHIIETCTQNNARAYIRLNKRNSAVIALKMIQDIAAKAVCNQTQSLFKVYDSIVGQNHSDPNKTWIVDIDNTDVNEAVKIRMYVRSITDIQGVRAMLKTLNGYHLITKPFNRKLFSEKYPDIDIHTDNPTLLYYNNE